MRIAIISDVHANFAALRELPRDYDQLWVLGDLVNYGPRPVEAVDWIRSNAALIVRGNHDHSAGFGVDPRCSARFRIMAEATGRYTASVLDASHKRFLRELPLKAQREVDGVRFQLCHALPSEPLYPYCGPHSEHWEAEAASIDSDVLLVGHTHLAFRIERGGRVIVNPGSLGQPKTGRPEACYAIWDGNGIELRSFAYDVEQTVGELHSLPLEAPVRDDLISVLRTGTAGLLLREAVQRPET